MEMIRPLNVIRQEWPILSITLFAFLLRISNLTTQSLWLDELHNMIEADPSISWREMFFYLRCCDQHPPLYFIVERIAFTFFGHTDFVARIISVIAGTLSVPAIWLLGKEFGGKSLGIIAALITSVNFYNLTYSQEARGYIFAFLFAALSFLFFVRLVKNPHRKNALWYALYTLCLLYTHYYSLFVVVAQGLLALLFLFQERDKERIQLFRTYLLSYIVIIVGYLPWVPFMLEMSKIKSFWLGSVSPLFFKEYFYNYFGDSKILKPFLLVFLGVYIIHIAGKFLKFKIGKIKDDPLILSFVVLFTWTFVTYLIPYLRSVLVVPMLFARYTIVVVPAVIIVISYGIDAFKVPLLKYLLTSLFLVFSIIDIFIVKDFYHKIRKSQFREMTQYIVNESPGPVPIINQVTSWHHRYHLKLFNSKAELITGVKEQIIDSIVSSNSPRWALDTFWLAGAHGESQPSEEYLKKLEEKYILLKQKKFYDAWAKLFVSKTQKPTAARIIKFRNLSATQGAPFSAEGPIPLWGGAILANPILLDTGKYRVTIMASGTPAKKVFPHLAFYINAKMIGDYFVSGKMEEFSFEFENAQPGEANFKIDLDNDLSIPGDGDRNAFINYIIIKKVD